MAGIDGVEDGQCEALLNGLPELALKQMSERILTKPIISGEVLYSPGAPLLCLIFPLSGIVSLQADLKDGRTVEEASIGREGVLGLEYFLGERRADYNAVVTVSGRASWLAFSDFEPVLQQFPDIQEVFQKSLRNGINRLRTRMICASVHSASQRMATWLLRAQDSTGQDQFELTQRTLAGLFGLRLATISDASSRLSAAGAIDQTRGMLTIISRPMLERAACECYGRLRDGTSIS